MSFLTGTFLFALFAVAGPVLIHLLNRRRFRTVDWAAMDFLHAAIRRSRRIMELRDLALLALRTLAVLLFVLAGFGIGARNDVFLNCDDFKVSGNDLPANCISGPTTPNPNQ